VPAGKTDQVQPIDDGAGQQYKLYIGQEEDAWLEDDDNLRKWENDELTASDRRILFANWYSVVAQLRQCTGARGERVIGDVVT
jgi:hypothetical protein